MSAADEEARATAYRLQQRRKRAAKAAAEARLLVTDWGPALAIAASWAAVRRWHPQGVPLIGDDQ